MTCTVITHRHCDGSLVFSRGTEIGWPQGCPAALRRRIRLAGAHIIKANSFGLSATRRIWIGARSGFLRAVGNETVTASCPQQPGRLREEVLSMDRMATRAHRRKIIYKRPRRRIKLWNQNVTDSRRPNLTAPFSGASPFGALAAKMR